MSMQFSSLHARSQELVLVRLVLQYSASEMILKVDKHKHHVHTTQQSVITPGTCIYSRDTPDYNPIIYILYVCFFESHISSKACFLSSIIAFLSPSSHLPPAISKSLHLISVSTALARSDGVCESSKLCS